MLARKSFTILIAATLLGVVSSLGFAWKYTTANIEVGASFQQEPASGVDDSDPDYSSAGNLIFLPVIVKSSNDSEIHPTPAPTLSVIVTSTPISTPILASSLTPRNTVDAATPSMVPSDTLTPIPQGTVVESPTQTATVDPSATLTPTPVTVPTWTATATVAIPQVAEIRGRVGIDRNADSFLDHSESGIKDVIVNLLDEQGQIVRTTSTETGFGSWHFHNLLVAPETNFSVAVDENSLPVGYALTTNNVPAPITLSPGETKEGYNFGYASTGDSDGLPDEIELVLGTNPNAIDTDFDQLSDLEELLVTGTDPTKIDSDANGVPDQLEDLDGDGLTNEDEIFFGTDPLLIDSDGDSLSDSVELRVFHSDPLNIDTDDDGLADDSEYRLGTDPTDPDSNGDGLLDGQEVYTSIATNPNVQAVVEFKGVGDIAKKTNLQNLVDDTRFQQLSGQISSAVVITTTSQFDSARVKIFFNPSQAPNGNMDDLQILHYDEQEQVFQPLASHGVNVDERYAWADITDFSPLVLFHIPTWEAVWADEMEPTRGEGDANFKNIDVVIMLDSSGSMSSNDPAGLRRTATIEFIKALINGDRVGIVDFDSLAVLLQPLTEDFSAAITAVKKINARGGTNIGVAVAISNQELIKNGDRDHLLIGILLTDGQGEYDSNLTLQASDAGIVIYTIGLGDAVNQNLLQSIADGTGGEYYPITNADQLPDVFRKISQDGGNDKDTDGDGLFDWLEKQGIRNGRGTIVTTNPVEWDTDGDGLSDGEEIGRLEAAVWGIGSYYSMQTDPNKQDTDSDGLLDPDEFEVGTNPYLADTDGDGLTDALEINANFDPLDSNPDDDYRPDNVEYAKGSDPFYFDPTPQKAAVYFLCGFVLGDLGESLLQTGQITEDQYLSINYLSGWFTSGSITIGDTRALLESLIRLDAVDTILNTATYSSLWGDGEKVTTVFVHMDEYVAKAGKKAELVKPWARWVAKTYGNQTFYAKLLNLFGYADEVLIAIPQDQLDDLILARNAPDLIARAVKQGVRFSNHKLSPEQITRVEQRMNTLWEEGANLAEASAVESAVELLSQEYIILYVKRNRPIELLDGTSKHLTVGPDIIAYNKATQRTAVVEVKGSVDTLSLNDIWLRSKVQGRYIEQPSGEWLSTDPRRYLAILETASQPELQDAADRLNGLIEQFGRNTMADYEAIVVGYSSQTAQLGKLDRTLESLTAQAMEVQFLIVSN